VNSYIAPLDLNCCNLMSAPTEELIHSAYSSHNSFTQLSEVRPRGCGQEAGTWHYLFVWSAEKMVLYPVDNLLRAQSSLASTEVSLIPTYQQVFGVVLHIRTLWCNFRPDHSAELVSAMWGSVTLGRDEKDIAPSSPPSSSFASGIKMQIITFTSQDLEMFLENLLYQYQTHSSTMNRNATTFPSLS